MMRRIAVPLAVVFVCSSIAVAQNSSDPVSVTPTPQPSPELNEIFTEFAAAEDKGDEAVDKVFREHPYEVIFLVDRNLEGWLSEQEKPAGERVADSEKMLKRALYAASRADAVFDVKAYSSYANAWKGWTPEQRLRFRNGQGEFQNGSEALKAKQIDAARKHFAAALAAANDVGDTWGIAQAEQKLGDIAFGSGDLASAETHMKKSLELFGAMRHIGMLRSLRGLAALYEREGKNKEALAALEKMVAVANEADRGEAAQKVKADIERLRQAIAAGPAGGSPEQRGG